MPSTLDSLADLLYDTEDDEELIQIEDPEIRLRVKKERLTEQAKTNLKLFVPLISNFIGFFLANKCKVKD